MSNREKRWKVVSGTITRRAESGPRRRAGRGGNRYRPGDVFTATEYEVRNCRDQVRLLDVEDDSPAPISEPVSENHGTSPANVDAPADGADGEETDGDIEHEPASEERPRYEAREAAPGWWDVVDVKTGEAVNDKRLREQKARDLAADVNAATVDEAAEA